MKLCLTVDGAKVADLNAIAIEMKGDDVSATMSFGSLPDAVVQVARGLHATPAQLWLHPDGLDLRYDIHGWRASGNEMTHEGPAVDTAGPKADRIPRVSQVPPV